MYKSEKEFLKNYDSSKYEKLSVTVDICMLSISDEEVSNYRKRSNKNMSVLLVKRDDYPFKDKWCLSGGFLNVKNELLEEAANRILKKETYLSGIYLEQLYTFDALDRDPRMRVLSTSFVALVDKKRLDTKLNPNASWFNIEKVEKGNMVTLYFDNGSTRFSAKIKKVLKEKTTDRYDFEIIENECLAFDHARIILSGIERIKNKISYTDVVFNMMPKYFTLGELQQVYEVILGKKLLDPAFRRIIASKVVKTEKMKTGEGHRPSYLFTYKKGK